MSKFRYLFTAVSRSFLFEYSDDKIYQIFYNVCGEHLRTDVRPYVEEFSHGGMSSGQLSGEFWIDKGIPLIVSRYRKIMLESGLEREI